MLQLTADCLRSAHIDPGGCYMPGSLFCAHSKSQNYTLRSMYISVVYLRCINVYLTLEKKFFFYLFNSFKNIFFISNRVFLFIIVNADFIILIATLVSILKCQRIKQMFFSLSEKKSNCCRSTLLH